MAAPDRVSLPQHACANDGAVAILADGELAFEDAEPFPERVTVRRRAAPRLRAHLDHVKGACRLVAVKQQGDVVPDGDDIHRVFSGTEWDQRRGHRQPLSLA
jgi:hypothetical protein